MRNRRAGQMWDIISSKVDVSDKTVIDLGCGYGDLLVRACTDGAKRVIGIDRDEQVLKIAKGKLANCDRTTLRLNDIRVVLREDTRYDIAICTSVLPYLPPEDMANMVSWMSGHAAQSIIEVQYKGDGPGPDWLEDFRDMSRYLRDVGLWQDVQLLGATYPDGRREREIWLCQHSKS